MDDADKKNKKEIQWHPAFVVALQAILYDYKDDLEYRLEHPLTTGSLRIDILVVKKRAGAVIERQIAGNLRKAQNQGLRPNRKRSLQIGK